SLRSMMFNSSLCEAKGFARNIEAAYRRMWRQWCRGQGIDAPAQESTAGAFHSAGSEALCSAASTQAESGPTEDD
ncbi:MAG: hypothetical protein ACYSW0_19500, partial [Planctomycetota bacterium]